MVIRDPVVVVVLRQLVDLLKRQGRTSLPEVPQDILAL